MSGPFDGFLHLCTEEQGVGHDDIIKDYDIIIVTSELVIPSWIPFPTIVYELILVPLHTNLVTS